MALGNAGLGCSLMSRKGFEKAVPLEMSHLPYKLGPSCISVFSVPPAGTGIESSAVTVSRSAPTACAAFPGGKSPGRKIMPRPPPPSLCGLPQSLTK